MKLFLYITILTLCSFPVICFSQSSASDIKAAQQMVDDEQKVFRDYITMEPLNAVIKKDLQKFAVNDANSIQNNLQYLATASKDKRVKGIRSVSFFMKE